MTEAGMKSIPSGISSGGAYAQSFGTLPHETKYLDIDIKSLIVAKSDEDLNYHVNLRPGLLKAAGIGLKALTTSSGGAGTAGFAMVPIFVDPRVIDRTRKNTPIVEIIPRVTNNGMFADYNVVTAKGGGIMLGEDGVTTERDTTFARQSSQIKFLYAIGRVTGPSQAATPSFILQGLQPTGGAAGTFTDQNALNAKQLEVLLQTRNIRELEENIIINGNATTSYLAQNSDGTEFDGIIQLMSTTNEVAKASAALSLNDTTTAIQYAFDDGGRPNIGICASAVYSDLLGLLTAKIGYLQPTAQVFWGFSTIVLHTMVGQIPIIPSMFMSNTSGNKALYFLDLSVVEMRVLQDLTFEDLAKTNDSQKFMLKIYETLIIKATTFCSSITSIG